MAWFALSISRIANCTNALAPGNETSRGCLRLLQMGVVMKAPLWAKYDYDVTAEPDRLRKNDYSTGRRHNSPTCRSEYIDALMDPRRAPGLEPEGVFVPVGR